jgi:hypothetical protein
MSKNLIDLIALYGQAKASAAFAEAKAEDNATARDFRLQYEKDRDKADKKAAGYLADIHKLIGVD